MTATDGVKQTSNTTGTGTWSLVAAPAGFRGFATHVPSNSQCYYHAADGSGNTEDGIGTLITGSPNTLSRDTVTASTNGGAKVNFTTTVTLTLGSLPTGISVGSGGLVNIQYFLTAGTFTYTPTTGTGKVLIYCCGAGGGSGGVASTSAIAVANSGGGGGGGTAMKFMTTGFSGKTIVVGGGGSAGSSGANNGGGGASSTFDTTVLVGGGGGGGAGSSGQSAGGAGASGQGGPGGTATGGDVNMPGGCGGMGFPASSATTKPGDGGSSYFTGTLQGPYTTTGQQAAIAGAGTGGGASGAANFISQSDAAGAAGHAGGVVIYEYA